MRDQSPESRGPEMVSQRGALATLHCGGGGGMQGLTSATVDRQEEGACDIPRQLGPCQVPCL